MIFASFNLYFYFMYEAPSAVWVMAWLVLFSGRDSWNRQIIEVMAWKWCMAWWRDRPLFLGVNCEFRLSFTWCMKGEEVKRRIISNLYDRLSDLYNIGLISRQTYIGLIIFKFCVIIVKINCSSRSNINYLD